MLSTFIKLPFTIKTFLCILSSRLRHTDWLHCSIVLKKQQMPQPPQAQI